MIFRGVEVKEGYQVRVTGDCSSEGNLRYVNLEGVVATTSPADDDGPKAIKIWPDNDSTPGNGKLWFLEPGVESIEVLDAGEDDNLGDTNG